MHTWHATGTSLRVQTFQDSINSEQHKLDDSVQKLDLGKTGDLERQIALP